jgi:diguanylate cyclase (GGDEF)-like protein
MAARAQRSDAERRHDAASGVECIALLDIDHFKHINDRWGHGVGDAVLVEVARRLEAAVRDSDFVLRWGGEEFLIFAPGANPDHIADMMARVLAGIGATPIDGGTATLPVTVTAGVITLPLAGVAGDGADWERGIRLADWALYQGKRHGRNQARIVTRLAAPVESVLAALDAAPGSDGADMVQMTAVHGPARTAAP